MRLFALPVPLLLVVFSEPGNAATFEDLSARATAAREANDAARAIGLYKEALHLNAKWQEGWWFLGTLQYDTDQYAGGRDALEHFVELNRRAAPAWGLLGLCEFETGDYTHSLAHIQRSLKLGPGGEPRMNEVLLYHEALLLTRAGHFDQAIQKYRGFLHGGEPRPSLLIGIGLAALRTALVPKEITAGRQDLFMMAGRAAYFSMTGDSGNAQQAFDDLLQRFPAAKNVHYIYGCYLLPARMDLAMEELKRELEISSSNAAARAMLAWALWSRGDFAAALPYAEKAAQDGPALPLAQYVFGRVLIERAESQRAIEHLELAEKMEPENLEDHLALATAYSMAGRSQDASRERRRSIEMAKEADPVARP